MSEDKHLPADKRRKLIATSRDLPRNYAIAAWMVRKHLDYVSSFAFQSRTGYTAFDDRLEDLVRWWARRNNFDLAGRHNLARWIRLAERSRVLDGDVIALKHSSGRVQAIEGDRIRQPTGGQLPPGLDVSKLTHGVKTSATGRALAFALHDRGPLGDSFRFKRMLPAKHCFHHAYWDRFDQVRGISPLASGINTLQDTYEGMTYALAKAKVTQLFGVKITRNADESMGDVTAETDEEGNEVKSGYEVKLGDGPFQLDMDAGEDADFMESKHPSAEFREFMTTMVMVALKSLDIPYSFFDESFTTYSGQRTAWIQYDQAAEVKRQDNRELLDSLIAWRITLWIIDGTLQLPPGVTSIEDLRWEWVARGIPWIDPLKEIKADAESVKLRTNSRQRLTRRAGEDWFEIQDELDVEEKRIVKNRKPMPGDPEEGDETDDEPDAQKTEEPAHAIA